jgi:nucleotide-binding universal stress UspA family protein
MVAMSDRIGCSRCRLDLLGRTSGHLDQPNGFEEQTDMSPTKPRKTALLYAPVETFSLDRGPTRFALDLCREHGVALSAMLLHTDMIPGRAEESETLARRNTDNQSGLEAHCRANGTALRTISTIDHSRGFFPYVNDHVRLHDLVICGNDNSSLLAERLVCEAVLFDGGRPLLLVPHRHDQGYAARHIAVAWDNSRNSARALGDALALLPGVKTATFIVIGDEKTLTTSIAPEALEAMVALHGIEVTIRSARKGKRAIGAALQDEALQAGADLLVMGAYGHSRLREFVLGGATQEVLTDLRLPVLMSH